VGGARVEYDQMKAFEGADFVYAKNWSAVGAYGKILSMDPSWTVGKRQMDVTDDAGKDGTPFTTLQEGDSFRILASLLRS
jgi:ornithine carbamoyltransferase